MFHLLVDSLTRLPPLNHPTRTIRAGRANKVRNHTLTLRRALTSGPNRVVVATPRLRKMQEPHSLRQCLSLHRTNQRSIRLVSLVPLGLHKVLQPEVRRRPTNHHFHPHLHSVLLPLVLLLDLRRHPK